MVAVLHDVSACTTRRKVSDAAAPRARSLTGTTRGRNWSQQLVHVRHVLQCQRQIKFELLVEMAHGLAGRSGKGYAGGLLTHKSWQ